MHLNEYLDIQSMPKNPETTINYQVIGKSLDIEQSLRQDPTKEIEKLTDPWFLQNGYASEPHYSLPHA